MPDIQLPNFNIDPSEIPTIRLKSIRFENFKAFENYKMDFCNNGECNPFVCFVGPNGYGKTTILDGIITIFSKYDDYEEDRLKALLGKSVRHVDYIQKGIYNNDDFLITAEIQSSLGDYQVQLNKKGFIKDHPEEIKSLIYRLCFFTRFDQELHQFQLPRDKWSVFKELFESVTDFTIEETKTLFDESNCPEQADLLKKYVLGFIVNKPHEKISHKECSAGERKIIKSFSTLLTKEYTPQIILIDNVTMHVEEGRHINLIKSIQRSFPNSQLFVTAHSYYISKNLSDRSQICDLRLMKSPDIVKKQPWRLYLSDEISDCVFKLKSMSLKNKIVENKKEQGKKLIEQCYNDCDEVSLLSESECFMKDVSSLFVQDIGFLFNNKK